MSAQESGVLVIYRSVDGCKTWEAVKPDDVPKWLQDAEVLGRMVGGEAAKETDEAEDWFIALRAPDQEDTMLIAAARAKRIRRLNRNIQVVH